jgi:glycosyltransferase involved in cell wall biosynthesis
MSGSLPLAAPWNGADKNLARILIELDTSNRFIFHTGVDERWDDARGNHIVRSRHTAAMPTAQQKLRSFGFLLRHVRSADLIHLVASLEHPSPLNGLLVRCAAQIGRVPVVHTIPSVGDGMIKRRNFPGAVSVVFSEDTRDRLRSQGITNVIRVYPPVSLARLVPQSEPGAVRRQFDLGERAVLCATHYGPASGIPELIRAFAALPPQLADVVLVMANRTRAGQDRAEEERQVRAVAQQVGVEQRLRILNDVADMPALIRACSVTVLVPGKLASKMDLPLIVLESLALARPAIVSDVPPLCEALLGDSGCRDPYQNIARLTDAIAEIVSNPERAATLGLAGQRAIRDLCDPLRVIDTYQGVFDQASNLGTHSGYLGGLSR